MKFNVFITLLALSTMTQAHPPAAFTCKAGPVGLKVFFGQGHQGSDVTVLKWGSHANTFLSTFASEQKTGGCYVFESYKTLLKGDGLKGALEIHQSYGKDNTRCSGLGEDWQAWLTLNGKKTSLNCGF